MRGDDDATPFWPVAPITPDVDDDEDDEEEHWAAAAISKPSMLKLKPLRRPAVSASISPI